MRFGRFRIDRERLTLEHDGTLLPLAPKSVELLLTLVERPGDIVSKHDLLDRLWPDRAVEEANLSQHVYVIRKLLEARDPEARAAIVTIPKRGYRFVAPAAGWAGQADGPTRDVQADGPTRDTQAVGQARDAQAAVPVRETQGAGWARDAEAVGSARDAQAVGPVREAQGAGWARDARAVGQARDARSGEPTPGARLLKADGLPVAAPLPGSGASVLPPDGRRVPLTPGTPHVIPSLGAAVEPPVSTTGVSATAAVSRSVAAATALAWFSRCAVGLAIVLVVALTGGAKSGKPPDGAPQLSADGSEAARLGRYYLDLRTATGIGRSRSYFARVIASDPRNPVGYAGLADALNVTADYHVGRLPRATLERQASALAHRAVELGPLSAEAHTSLAVVAQYANDEHSAVREFERAIALDPNYAPAHHWLGTLLFDRGEYARSLHELTLAARLNPVATATNAWLEIAAYFAHRYDTAIEHGNRAIELDPSRRDSLRELGLAYEAKGDHRSALATFARIRKTDDASAGVPFLVAAVYAHAGRPQIARRILAHEHLRSTVDPELPFALLALGNPKAAAAAATRLRFHGCHDRRMFADDPRLDPVRDDAAFGQVFDGRCAGRD